MSDRLVAVLDANVLLNLATPVVDARAVAPSGDDPLRAVLSAYDVRVPNTVLGEVAEASEGEDFLAAAAEAVTKAAHHLTTHDVADGVDDSLGYGLDPGESRGIRLANDLEADLFVTDEFEATNYLLVSLALDDRNALFTTPHVLCRLANRGILTSAYVDATLTYLCDLKHWDESYVDQLRAKYLRE